MWKRHSLPYKNFNEATQLFFFLFRSWWRSHESSKVKFSSKPYFSGNVSLSDKRLPVWGQGKNSRLSALSLGSKISKTIKPQKSKIWGIWENSELWNPYDSLVHNETTFWRNFASGHQNCSDCIQYPGRFWCLSHSMTAWYFSSLLMKSNKKT